MRSALTKSEVKNVVWKLLKETEIYTPSQKLFASKGEVLDPIIFDNVYFD